MYWVDFCEEKAMVANGGLKWKNFKEKISLYEFIIFSFSVLNTVKF